MRNVRFNKKAMVIYLIFTFGLAYIIQICAASLYEKNRVIGQLVTAAMMFVPALGAVLSGAKLKEMGWKPQIRKNIKIFLIAWFGSMILTVVGAALYFLIFPKHFDISGEYFVAAGGAEALEQMKAQGISYSVYLLITLVSSISYAPLLNMFVALGEEIGWRGFMYPQLKARFGRRKGWILGGVIWGAWHWPLIWLIGYEYGAAAGNPIGYAALLREIPSGMQVFRSQACCCFASLRSVWASCTTGSMKKVKVSGSRRSFMVRSMQPLHFLWLCVSRIPVLSDCLVRPRTGSSRDCRFWPSRRFF